MVWEGRAGRKLNKTKGIKMSEQSYKKAKKEVIIALCKQVLETQAQIGTPPAQEWARIPRTGQTLEGLFRSQIFALVKSGKVKSAAIKKPGDIRAGMRLVYLPSLRAYIASFANDAHEVK
jgi:ribonuclease D